MFASKVGDLTPLLLLGRQNDLNQIKSVPLLQMGYLHNQGTIYIQLNSMFSITYWLYSISN